MGDDGDFVHQEDYGLVSDAWAQGATQQAEALTDVNARTVAAAPKSGVGAALGQPGLPYHDPMLWSF